MAEITPLRVLVVDDDDVDRMSVRRSLPKVRVDITEASDGDSAIEHASKKTFDVVLLDYFLPPDTGIEVLARLREKAPDVPVIFLSGHGSEDVAVQAMKAGAADYLPKAALGESDRLWRLMNTAIERWQLQRDSQRAQARLALALEAAGAGTWELDLTTNELRAGERFKTLFGLQSESTDGHHVWPLQSWLDALETPATLTEQLSTGTVAAQLRTKDQQRWLDVRGRLEQDRAGPRFFGTVSDITASKAAEAHSTALRERLMGIASHDLKNPLNAVLQASALLARNQQLDERGQKYVGHIQTSAQRMTALIVQLLDLTRVRLGGGLPLQRKEMSLREVMLPAIEELRIARPGRTINVDVSDVKVNADPDRIAQVVSNLVGNALKHSPENEPVSVRGGVRDGKVVFEVHNGGIAIPKEKQASVFEPFVQLGENPHEREGLGLGLYISAEVVRAHGGVLRLESAEGTGTTFIVEMPN